MITDQSKQIHDAALAHGYDSCGIVPIDRLDFYRERLEQRLQEIPESSDVYASSKAFLALKENYPWAKSVVVCTEYWGKYKFPKSLQRRYAKGLLLSLSNIPDSEEFKRRRAFESWLESHQIRFVGGETAKPAGIIPLRPASVAAGLGVYRKNNFFYGPKGSFYELAAYLIDVPCEYIEHVDVPPCPEQCNLCLRGCTTRSLSKPFTMNPLTCVSFINTFGGGIIPDGFTEEVMQDWILGCDNCQDSCPFNASHNWDEGLEYPGMDGLETLLQPEAILTASDELLQEQVIPKLCFHLTNEQLHVLRQSAKRVLMHRR